MPTNFTEPFAGSGVEAMLCGTPLIAVDYGAFTETIVDGVTGFRCHTLQDWIDAIHNADKLDRRVVAETARSRYSLETCGKKYDKIFRAINDLNRKGWYQLRDTDEIDYTYLHNEELPFAKRLAQWITDNLKPKKVLDIGCGPGTYVNCLQDLGVNAIGYDSDTRIDGTKHLVCKSLFDLEDTGNVVLCMEVAEHINGSNNQQIVEVMANALEPDGILIWTAAKPGQGGVGHINCQTKEYWADLFATQPLERCLDIEDQLVDAMKAGYHMGWFIQNLLVYKKPAVAASLK
jgi:2-polyprenyl-3-methyl-5-hydroxy-6-metoxy-1,4-benzoquinol methylase